MVYSNPPGYPTNSNNITYDDTVSNILTGSNSETLQDAVEALAARKGIVLETISLNIPANTWTLIPLPATIAIAHDYKIYLGDQDITQGVQSRRAGNSFEIQSLNSLSTTIEIEGTK